MSRASILTLVGGTAAILASPALAQPDETETGRALTAQVSGATSTSIANGPNDSLLKSSRVPDFQILADGDDSQASLTLSYGLNAIRRGDRLTSNQATFSISAKLDDAGDAKLLGLRGLPAGAEIKAAFTHFGGKVVLDGKVPRPVLIAERLCREAGGADCRADEYPTGAGDFVAKYNPEGSAPLLDEVFRGPVHFFGLEVSGDRGSYDFLDRTTFAVESEDHSGYGGSVFGGWLFNRGMSSFTAAYTYKRSWSAQDEVTLCQPVAGTAQSQCITAADGAPTRENRSIASLEFRRAFGGTPGEFATVAIAPEVSFDFENDAYSISLPVYLVGDGAGKLRGGVRAVYLNEEGEDGRRDDDFTLSLFVGVPFTVFGR